MLYPGIGRVLEAVVGSGMELRVVTNGNYLPTETLPSLVRAAEVRVSIDSIDRDTYNQQRGMRGGDLLARTLANLRMLVATRAELGGTVTVACTCLISTLNQGELEKFTETLIDDIGVDKVAFKQDIYGDIGFDDPGVPDRLAALGERYGARVDSRDESPTVPVSGPCAVPYVKAAFNPYGELYSCCLGSQPGETNGVPFGALSAHGSFEQLWLSTAWVRRQMLTCGVSCSDCNYTDRLINLSLASNSDDAS